MTSGPWLSFLLLVVVPSVSLLVWSRKPRRSDKQERLRRLLILGHEQRHREDRHRDREAAR